MMPQPSTPTPKRARTLESPSSALRSFSSQASISSPSGRSTPEMFGSDSFGSGVPSTIMNTQLAYDAPPQGAPLPHAPLRVTPRLSTSISLGSGIPSLNTDVVRLCTAPAASPDKVSAPSQAPDSPQHEPSAPSHEPSAPRVPDLPLHEASAPSHEPDSPQPEPSAPQTDDVISVASDNVSPPSPVDSSHDAEAERRAVAQQIISSVLQAYGKKWTEKQVFPELFKRMNEKGLLCTLNGEPKTLYRVVDMTSVHGRKEPYFIKLHADKPVYGLGPTWSDVWGHFVNMCFPSELSASGRVTRLSLRPQGPNRLDELMWGAKGGGGSVNRGVQQRDLTPMVDLFDERFDDYVWGFRDCVLCTRPALENTGPGQPSFTVFQWDEFKEHPRFKDVAIFENRYTDEDFVPATQCFTPPEVLQRIVFPQLGLGDYLIGDELPVGVTQEMMNTIYAPAFEFFAASLVAQFTYRTPKYVLVIYGAPGSGKTTLANFIKTVAGANNSACFAAEAKSQFYLSKTLRDVCVPTKGARMKYLFVNTDVQSELLGGQIFSTDMVQVVGSDKEGSWAHVEAKYTSAKSDVKWNGLILLCANKGSNGALPFERFSADYVAIDRRLRSFCFANSPRTANSDIAEGMTRDWHRVFAYCLQCVEKAEAPTMREDGSLVMGKLEPRNALWDIIECNSRREDQHTNIVDSFIKVCLVKDDTAYARIQDVWKVFSVINQNHQNRRTRMAYEGKTALSFGLSVARRLNAKITLVPTCSVCDRTDFVSECCIRPSSRQDEGYLLGWRFVNAFAAPTQ